MKTLTIEQKSSGTGSIHDIASENYDRTINFKSNNMYAIVFASYYNKKTIMCNSDASLVKQYNKVCDYSFQILDCNGTRYSVDCDDVVLWQGY